MMKHISVERVNLIIMDHIQQVNSFYMTTIKKIERFREVVMVKDSSNRYAALSSRTNTYVNTKKFKVILQC